MKAFCLAFHIMIDKAGRIRLLALSYW